MSDILGPLTFGKKEEQIFLGRDISQHRDYSEQTAQTIDREVRDIVERNYQRAKTIIAENIASLNRIAEALLEFETIDGEEVDQLIRGEKIVRVPKVVEVAGSAKPDESEKRKPESGGTPAPLPA